MTDQYRLTDQQAPADRPLARPVASLGHRMLRLVLWAVMIPAAGFNAVQSFAGQNGWSLAAGIVASACLVGLIVSYVLGRRR
ncbi:hypothetical protein [Longispora urticae]